jgi:hypothetical protein
MAVIIGLAVGILLSVITDMTLLALGFDDIAKISAAPFLLVLFIISYRFIFNTIGCYLAAKLAPAKPMRHAMALGLLGFLISSAGAVFMWSEAPPYYHIAFVILAFPAAWLGGLLHRRSLS